MSSLSLQNCWIFGSKNEFIFRWNPFLPFTQCKPSKRVAKNIYILLYVWCLSKYRAQLRGTYNVVFFQGYFEGTDNLQTLWILVVVAKVGTCFYSFHAFILLELSLSINICLYTRWCLMHSCPNLQQCCILLLQLRVFS